jgi:hypothetical protein
MEITGIEGLLTAIVLLLLPFLVLAVLIKILPPWDTKAPGSAPEGVTA